MHQKQGTAKIGKDIIEALNRMLNAVIDLSHHNVVTSFPDARSAGIAGVIHKATEGRTFVDSDYHARKKLALDAGLLWGAYHFGTNSDVAPQVEHFLETIAPDPNDLMVLDFERLGTANTMTLSQAEEFVTLIEQKTGRFPGLYSGQNFLRSQVGSSTDTVLKNCFLWIARYSDQMPVVPPAWKTFTLWQYTDGTHGPQPHEIAGIGPCDRDKFNGTLANLKRLWGVK